MLAPGLPEPARSEALVDALAAVSRIVDEQRRAAALEALSSHLPKPLLPAALATARGIKFDGDRARALVALAPYLPEALLAEAVAAAVDLHEFWKVEALTALAPRLPEPLLAEALAAARGMTDERKRDEMLAKLAPRLAGASPG